MQRGVHHFTAIGTSVKHCTRRGGLGAMVYGKNVEVLNIKFTCCCRELIYVFQLVVFVVIISGLPAADLSKFSLMLAAFFNVFL